MNVPTTDAARRLIDACDRLIREAGSAGPVTTRQVAEAAGLSPSSVVYHFGSFEDLIAAVGLRAYRRLNYERMAALQAAVDRHAPALPPLREILRALIEPPVLWHFNRDNAYCVLMSINGMVAAGERSGPFRQIEASMDAHRAIVSYLHRAAPWLSEAEVGWRVYAILAIRTQALRGLYRSVALTQGRLDLKDPEVVVASITDIAVPMFARPGDGEGPLHRF